MLPQEIKQILERGDYRIENGKLERFNKIEGVWNGIIPDNKGIVRIKNMKNIMEAVSIGQFMPNNMKEVMKHSGEPTLTKEKVEFKVNDFIPLFKHETEVNPLMLEKRSKHKVRSTEIAEIRKLHSEGVNNTHIAKQLNLPRPTVIGIVNKIKNGKQLRYEDKLPPKTK